MEERENNTKSTPRQYSTQLSQGLMAFGTLYPFPLMARPNGSGSNVYLSRQGTGDHFNISLEEIEALSTYAVQERLNLWKRGQANDGDDAR